MKVSIVAYETQIHVYRQNDPAAVDQYETAYMSGGDPVMYYDVSEQLTEVLSGNIPGYTVTDHR